MAEMKKGGLLDGAGSEWDGIDWTTVDNGQHVPIKDGQTKQAAIKTHFEKAQSLTDAANSEGEAQRSGNIKGQRAKLAALAGKPEGTYDLETGKPVSYESGYQVSFQQTSDSYTDEEYDAKVEEMIKRTGSRAHGGVFGEPEVSFHIENESEAMAIAKEYNQHSIFDWDKGELKLNPHYVEHKNKIKR